MARLISILIVVAGLGASVMLAAAASKPLTKPKKVAASISATFAAPIPLPCTTGTRYAATCPESSGACSCIKVRGSATGGFGKATVAGAITLDNFDTTPENGCTPIYGSLTLIGTSSTTTMDINGSLCNATLPAGTKTIGGGFDFDPDTLGLIGTGSISGSIAGNGSATLKLVGAIAPASPTPTATPTQ